MENSSVNSKTAQLWRCSIIRGAQSKRFDCIHCLKFCSNQQKGIKGNSVDTGQDILAKSKMPNSSALRKTKCLLLFFVFPLAIFRKSEGGELAPVIWNGLIYIQFFRRWLPSFSTNQPAQLNMKVYLLLPASQAKHTLFLSFQSVFSK